MNSYPARFFELMFRMRGSVVVAGLFLMIAAASANGAPQGALEGHLKIVFPWAAEPSDEMPRPEVGPKNYPDYALLILDAKDKKQVARVTPDKNGAYRVPLPPGAYILDVEGRAAKHLRASPREFTIVSNETVHVDTIIMIGLPRRGLNPGRH